MASDHASDFSNLAGRKAGAWTMAFLFAGESLIRSMNVTILPLQAYDLLGSSQQVSTVATFVSLAVLITTLLLPYIFLNARRRWVYTTGILMIVAAAFLFASYTVFGQVAGNYLRNTGAVVLSITLQLYIMDHIKKQDLVKSEPIRMALSTIPWVVGPFSGAWLYTHYGPFMAQMSVVIVGAFLAAGFWFARLTDSQTLVPGTITAFNPIKNTARFIAQPRLRLAWSIAFARSAFWSGMFIYGPLLVVEAGLGKDRAGLLLSVSQMVLPLSLYYGKLAQAYSVRVVIAASFAGMALCCFAAGLLGTAFIYPAMAFLLLGAIGATGLDGVGGIPFLRAVKQRDRREMTSVYRTYIEVAELAPGFVFMLLLLAFDVSIVFVTLSFLMAFMAYLTWRHLPKSM